MAGNALRAQDSEVGAQETSRILGTRLATPCSLMQAVEDCTSTRNGCSPENSLVCPSFISCLEAAEARIHECGFAARIPKWKRPLDLACVLLTAPFWGVFMLLIACFIKSVSKGPVFFRQQRVGFRGQRFACLKFRTMKLNADTAVHQNHLRELIASGRPMTKMDAMGDPRLIRGGKFLRSSGLDELPQLLNVLRGEMSIVGPRPCTPFEFDHYESWHRSRFNTLPGLTGLWQVSGKNKTTFRQMMLLDIYYAKHASLRLDCKIMLRTVGVLANQVEETRVKNGSPQPKSFPSSFNKERLPVT
jgi:exopolysaccharide production protein ExoY